MSWEDVNTHQIPFCTYKQTKWKTKNSLFRVAQTVPRSRCSMLFKVFSWLWGHCRLLWWGMFQCQPTVYPWHACQSK